MTKWWSLESKPGLSLKTMPFTTALNKFYWCRPQFTTRGRREGGEGLCSWEAVGRGQRKGAQPSDVKLSPMGAPTHVD